MRLAVSGCADGTIKLWDTQEEKLLKNLPSLKHSVSAVQFSADGKRIYASSTAGTIRVFEVYSDKHDLLLETHGFQITAFDLGSDGRLAVFNTGPGGSALALGDLKSGELVRSFDSHNAHFTAVCFSFDNQFVLSGGDDGSVTLWEAATGRSLKTIEAHDKKVTCVSMARDGRRFLRRQRMGA